MDPHTLACLAGYSDFPMTKRYVHAQQETVRKAIADARVGILPGIPLAPIPFT
jgi:hypothetical protein